MELSLTEIFLGACKNWRWLLSLDYLDTFNYNVVLFNCRPSRDRPVWSLIFILIFTKVICVQSCKNKIILKKELPPAPLTLPISLLSLLELFSLFLLLFTSQCLNIYPFSFWYFSVMPYIMTFYYKIILILSVCMTTSIFYHSFLSHFLIFPWI